MLSIPLALALAAADPASDGFSQVAHWRFDAGSVPGKDLSGKGRDLPRVARSTDDRGWNPQSAAPIRGDRSDLGIEPGRVLRYQARVFLERYPSSRLHNGRSVVMGYYAGPKILVTDRGGIQAGGQKGSDGNWNWYAPESDPGVVPLGRWTVVEIEADPRGSWRAWVDGKEVKIRSVPVAGDALRPSEGSFVLGADAMDGQLFPGWIAEAWVWERPLDATGAREQIIVRSDSREQRAVD